MIALNITGKAAGKDMLEGTVDEEDIFTGQIICASTIPVELSEQGSLNWVLRLEFQGPVHQS